MNEGIVVQQQDMCGAFFEGSVDADVVPRCESPVFGKPDHQCLGELPLQAVYRVRSRAVVHEDDPQLDPFHRAQGGQAFRRILFLIPVKHHGRHSRRHQTHLTNPRSRKAASASRAPSLGR